MKKFIALLITITLAIGTMTIYGASSSDANMDGDIHENPWSELFTTIPPDLDVPTEKETTTKEEITTTKEITSKNKKTKQGKVISATRKSKKAKRAKITIKKIKGAKGYQLQIATNKKFNKILVKRFVKNRKITVYSKKLKNKKKLYVRVKAYRLNGKTKVWGKWSAKKIIKIKKK